MIDFTAAQSRDYDRYLEERYSSEHSAEIQCKALQILRGMKSLDVWDALGDRADEIKHLVIQGHEHMLGFVVRQAIQQWAEDVAKREIEA